MKTCWACSDFHGNYKAYEAIKNYIGAEDIVYFLGDAGDRGPEPWKTITAVYNDPQFIYLKGNHEDMLVKAMNEWLPEHIKSSEYELLEWNGGHKTFQQWKDGPERNKWVIKLSTLPIYKIYTNINNQIIHLTHAGFTPPNMPEYNELLWSREHFYDDWTGLDTEYIVHGHTITSRYTAANTVWRYCNGHKIDIDIACYSSQKVALLNLDTFEVVYLDAHYKEDKING